MDGDAGPEIDPNARINPELLSVLKHHNSPLAVRRRGGNCGGLEGDCDGGYGSDDGSSGTSCVPLTPPAQRRRPFAVLQGDGNLLAGGSGGRRSPGDRRGGHQRHPPAGDCGRRRVTASVSHSMRHLLGSSGDGDCKSTATRAGDTHAAIGGRSRGRGRANGGPAAAAAAVRNRAERSKSCGSMMFRDDVFRQRSFGSPRPDVGHDVFSGGRLAVCPVVVPSGPPDFHTIVPRKALCHQFCRRTRMWTHSECRVRLSRSPFAKGSVRHAYYLQIDKPRSKLPGGAAGVVSGPGGGSDGRGDGREGRIFQGCVSAGLRGRTGGRQPRLSTGSGDEGEEVGHGQDPQQRRRARQRQLNQLPSHEYLYVAKRAIDPDSEPSLYFRDVEMQQHCAYYAQLFNQYNPPRRVQFLDAFVLELDSIYSHKPSIFFGVERHIEGQYCKHNNNHGYVETEDQRNTPQAFSHFTYEVSCQNMLVVDVQGVGDVYTDPQIHTIDGNNFGEGNLGARGFAKFLQTHRCNSICRYLQLNPIHPIDPRQDEGTAPTATAQQQRPESLHSGGGGGGFSATAGSLSRVPFREPHYYSRSHVLANVDDSSSTSLSHSSLGNSLTAGSRRRGGSSGSAARDRNRSLHRAPRGRAASGRCRRTSDTKTSKAPAAQQDVNLGCRCSIM